MPSAVTQQIRENVKKRLEDGVKTRDIAAEFNFSVSKVRISTSRALKRLELNGRIPSNCHAGLRNEKNLERDGASMATTKGHDGATAGHQRLP